MKNANLAQVPFTEINQRDINEITDDILFQKKQVEQSFIEIGKLLIEAKSQVSHGEWGIWLQEKVDFSETTARRFMRLAKEYPNQSAMTDLGFTKALMLLAIPSDEREEFMAETHDVNGVEKSVGEMTSREVEDAVRELKTSEFKESSDENDSLIISPILSRSYDDEAGASDESHETAPDDSNETTPIESHLMADFMKKFKLSETYITDMLDWLDDIPAEDFDTYFYICPYLSDLSETILTCTPSDFGIKMCVERVSEYLYTTTPSENLPDDDLIKLSDLIDLNEELTKFIREALADLNDGNSDEVNLNDSGSNDE